MSHYRQQFEGLKPKEIRYSIEDGTLTIRGNTFAVENPKIAFMEALHEWQESNSFEIRPTGSRIHLDCRVGEVIIGLNCTIGGYGFGYESIDGKYQRMLHHGDVVIEDGVIIHNNVNIDRGVTESTYIATGTRIDSNVHIGHNAKIGKNVLICANATVGGSAIIEDNAFIGCNAFIKQKVNIGKNATIGAGAVVLTDVPEGQTWAGNPAKQINGNSN